ncbi:MAG: SOS response-associated peptidase family protein [Gammaproteobacteria bacterium]
MGKLDSRMPSIIPPEAYDCWLRGTLDEAARLMRPCPSSWLTGYAVSPRVNKSANNDQRCIAPIDLKAAAITAQRELF